MIPNNYLDNIKVGLGWDTKCDIDSSILMMDYSHNLYSNVYFGNKKSCDGAVQHSGDNLTGEGSGDDETIFVNLTKVDPKV